MQLCGNLVRYGIYSLHVEQSTRMTLTVGSLFSGIGGLDLGLERAGMQVIWQSEIDPYACKVLEKHWPEVPNHGDIKQIDWRAVEPVDVICGGYPCQPFSQAGKRKGTDDPRHLWPWVRTAISELRPNYAILENVRGHLSMGGLQVIGELTEIGYDAEWRVVSAAGVGAPHRRDRIIIVAYPNSCDSSDGRQRKDVQSQNRSRRDDRGRSRNHLGQISLGSAGKDTGIMADTDSARLEGCSRVQERETKHGGFDILGASEGRSSVVGVSNDVSEWDGEHRQSTDIATQSRVWRNDRRREEAYDGWQTFFLSPTAQTSPKWNRSATTGRDSRRSSRITADR
jgi:DNA-cytosine methyltransferase